MKAFAYLTATTEREAVAALGGPRGRVQLLAGGMDLLGLMKDHLATPERLVNIKGLDATVTPTADGGLRIGAATKLVDVAEHERVVRAYPALALAADGVGTPQIRNMATSGGNIMQRPRCWYFRNEEFPCLKKGGSRCFAVEGENQFHAIFGEGPCYIVHPSSLAVPVIAYGGRFGVVGPTGARDVDAGTFFQMPHANLYGENVLQPDEILTHILLPPPGEKSAGYEVRAKQSHDWPLATASVNLVMSGSSVSSARVVIGAVAPVPWRAPEAERVLHGKVVTGALAAEAAAAAVSAAKPLSGNAYKIQIAKTAVRRAILRAAGLDARA